MDFCKCGSIKIGENCTNKQCPGKSNKLKGWVIDGIALDFKKPVTHEQALKAAKRLKQSE